MKHSSDDCHSKKEKKKKLRQKKNCVHNVLQNVKQKSYSKSKNQNVTPVGFALRTHSHIHGPIYGKWWWKKIETKISLFKWQSQLMMLLWRSSKQVMPTTIQPIYSFRCRLKFFFILFFIFSHSLHLQKESNRSKEISCQLCVSLLTISVQFFCLQSPQMSGER